MNAIQGILNQYYATTHQWMPIVYHNNLARSFATPGWEMGPDIALLLLAMKLIASSPPDGIVCSQNPMYLTAKRYIATLEAAGAASLSLLQGAIFVTWYEYGQCIYPVAFMSAGWCVRYGNMLGINGKEQAPQPLGRSVCCLLTM